MHARFPAIRVIIWETVQSNRHFAHILSRERIAMPTHDGCSAERESVLQAAGVLKTRLTSLEKALQAVDEEMNVTGSLVPNDTHPEAPIGPEENVCSGDKVVALGWCGNGTGALGRRFWVLVPKGIAVKPAYFSSGYATLQATTIHIHGAMPEFGFTPKDHVELGRRLDLFDFDTGAFVGNARVR
jgi:seryl-tRNA synthetase